MKIAASFAVAGLLLSAGPAWAQIDFSGNWIVDRDVSADLTKLTFEPKQTQAPRSTGMTGGFGGFGGRGSFGGGRPMPTRPSGGERNGGAAAPLTDEEKTRLREMATYVKGLTSIVIEHTDHSTFTVTDAQGRARLFPTDGTKTPQLLATATVDSVTKWDGPHMVTVFTIGPSRQLIFTYVLVPATKQMALRIQLEDSGRPRADVPELKLIYKLKASTQSSSGSRH